MLYKDAISDVIFVIVQLCDNVRTDHIVPMIETFVLVCAWRGWACIVDIYTTLTLYWQQYQLVKYLDIQFRIYSPLQAEGLTAIECWVIACIIFVFGALLEYTVILLKLKLKKVRGGGKHRNGNGYAYGGGARAGGAGAGPGETADLMPQNGRAVVRKKSSAQGEFVQADLL